MLQGISARSFERCENRCALRIKHRSPPVMKKILSRFAKLDSCHILTRASSFRYNPATATYRPIVVHPRLRCSCWRDFWLLDTGPSAKIIKYMRRCIFIRMGRYVLESTVRCKANALQWSERRRRLSSAVRVQFGGEHNDKSHNQVGLTSAYDQYLTDFSMPVNGKCCLAAYEIWFSAVCRSRSL